MGLRWASAVLLLAGVVGGAPNEPLPRNLSSSKSRTRMAPRGVVSTSQPPATEFAVAAAAGEKTDQDSCRRGRGTKKDKLGSEQFSIRSNTSR